MTKEEYWLKNKTKLQLNERSYNSFEMGVKFCENKIADIKANCDLVIEDRDVKIKELEQQIEKMKCCVNCNNYCQRKDRSCVGCHKYSHWKLRR